MCNRTERGRSPEQSISGSTENMSTSGDDAGVVESASKNEAGPREFADVAYTDGEGVLMPAEAEAVEESHRELLKNDEFTFEESTGLYKYDILVPEQVAENIQNKGLIDHFNKKSEVEQLVEEDDGYHLRGTAPRPEVGQFLLTMVEKGPALLGRFDT